MLAHYTFYKNFKLCLVFPQCTRWRADHSGLAVKVEALRPLACWDCGLEYHWELGGLSLVAAVSCQVEVSTTG
jgi:hypothetical protein